MALSSEYQKRVSRAMGSVSHLPIAASINGTMANSITGGLEKWM